MGFLKNIVTKYSIFEKDIIHTANGMPKENRDFIKKFPEFFDIGAAQADFLRIRLSSDEELSRVVHHSINVTHKTEINNYRDKMNELAMEISQNSDEILSLMIETARDNPLSKAAEEKMHEQIREIYKTTGKIQPLLKGWPGEKRTMLNLQKALEKFQNAIENNFDAQKERSFG